MNSDRQVLELGTGCGLRPGSIYLVDDLLPQPNWPDGHQANVDAYLANLKARDGFAFTQMDWATGVVMLVRC